MTPHAARMEEARDLADFNEPRQSHAEILSRNDRWAARRAERERKGRAGYVGQHEYRDGRIVRTIRTNAPDPILDLYAARKAVIRPAYDADVIARVNFRYGELRATVTSPVPLPADLKPVSLRMVA
jgi:hypothetical protein